MAEIIDEGSAATVSDTDLVAAVRQALQGSEEPLTLSKLRAALPPALRNVGLEALEESLKRQVAANVLYQYPKYRSQQNRYWDRPMRDHMTWLLRTTLEERSLTLSDLRRKLPDYAKNQAQEVLEEEVARGRLYRHPPLSSRSGPRYGVGPADPKEYLRGELSGVFNRLRPLGFTVEDLRAGALELLHDEEWAPGEERPAEEAAAPAEAPQAMSAAPQQQGDDVNPS